jgi:peptide subunit release factor 1 (eRF1)
VPTTITDEAIRELAAFRSEDAPVTTCYLDVDGRRRPSLAEVDQQLTHLLRQAHEHVDGDPSVAEDVKRFEAYVRSGIDRSRVRGLAMFSCSASSFFQAVELPVPVRDRLVVNATPAVAQLEAVLQEAEPVGVLLVDQQRARTFVFSLGELIEHGEQLDELPRDVDVPGHRDHGDPSHHIEALVDRHLRAAADLAWSVFQDEGFSWLLLAGPDHLLPSVESHLHPYLAERLAGHLDLPSTATLDQVRSAVLDAEHHLERGRQHALVERLRAAVGTNDRGVAGIDGVLEALGDARVAHLVVSDGFAQSGWRCTSCGRLATVGKACPRCENTMTHLDDVVEEAVEDALASGSRVEICSGNADLDVMGRVGAVLRF